MSGLDRSEVVSLLVVLGFLASWLGASAWLALASGPSWPVRLAAIAAAFFVLGGITRWGVFGFLDRLDRRRGPRGTPR